MDSRKSYNQITFDIRGASFQVYNELGPGLLETVYQNTLAYELINKGYKVEKEVPLPITYKNMTFDVAFRIDLLIEEKVLVEIKSVEKILKVHHKQILTYMKLSNIKLGLLINFNSDNLVKSIHRKVLNF